MKQLDNINLINKRRVGLWCRRGAWGIILLGILQIVFFLWDRFSASPYYYGTYFTVSEFTSSVQYLLQIIISTLFLFLLLYTAGVVADHLLGNPTASESAAKPAEPDTP